MLALLAIGSFALFLEPEKTSVTCIGRWAISFEAVACPAIWAGVTCYAFALKTFCSLIKEATVILIGAKTIQAHLGKTIRTISARYLSASSVYGKVSSWTRILARPNWRANSSIIWFEDGPHTVFALTVWVCLAWLSIASTRLWPNLAHLYERA